MNEIQTNFTLEGRVVHEMGESFLGHKLFISEDESTIYFTTKGKVRGTISISAEDGGYYGDVRSSLDFSDVKSQG